MIVIFTKHNEESVGKIIYRRHPEILFFNISYENNIYGAAVLDTPADDLMFRIDRKYRRYKNLIKVKVNKKPPSILKFKSVVPGSDNSNASNFLGFLDLDVYSGDKATFGTTNKTDIPAEFIELFSRVTVENILEKILEYEGI